MNDKQPKALWLADELEKYTYDFEWHSTAAAELRRLHEVNADLLSALKELLSEGSDTFPDTIEAAHAAIAKATGEQQ